MEGIGQHDARSLSAILVRSLAELRRKRGVIVGNDWALQLLPGRRQCASVRSISGCRGARRSDDGPRTYSRQVTSFRRDDQAWFYTQYFSKLGLAESELELDVAATPCKIYFSASGDVGVRDAGHPNPFGRCLGQTNTSMPSVIFVIAGLVDSADLEAFVRAIDVSGFRGGRTTIETSTELGNASRV